MRMQRKQEGFTLIELMIVIAIVAILVRHLCNRHRRRNHHVCMIIMILNIVVVIVIVIVAAIVIVTVMIGRVAITRSSRIRYTALFDTSMSTAPAGNTT